MLAIGTACACACSACGGGGVGVGRVRSGFDRYRFGAGAVQVDSANRAAWSVAATSLQGTSARVAATTASAAAAAAAAASATASAAAADAGGAAAATTPSGSWSWLQTIGMDCVVAGASFTVAASPPFGGLRLGRCLRLLLLLQGFSLQPGHLQLPGCQTGLARSGFDHLRWGLRWTLGALGVPRAFWAARSARA